MHRFGSAWAARAVFISALVAVVPALASTSTHGDPAGDAVAIRDLAHIRGVRDNPLVGYGIVAGLAGTGDSSRSLETLQSIANTLARFDIRVSPTQISSRNVASVLVTATLLPFVESGDKLDVNVASMGDALSLAGGTLMLAPLRGPDGKIYALAQGALSVGGFRYDAFGNLVQKNHPTAGQIPGGATLEMDVPTQVVRSGGTLNVVLDNPDYITAERIASILSREFPDVQGVEFPRVHAVDAAHVAVHLTPQELRDQVAVLARIQSTRVVPDESARVVVNERTGTVVSGGDVRLGKVSVAQGDLKVDISTGYDVSQPVILGQASGNVRSFIVPQTQIRVREPKSATVSMPSGTSVSDLVTALNRLKVPPRDMISILQAIKRAGSLHAQLIIQ